MASGMVKAVERAHAIGATALQIFDDNPTAWRRREAPPPELPAFRARLAELGIAPLVIHGSYLINLAGADAELVERSTTLLVSELRVAPSFGARFVNIHMGSHRDTSAAAGTQRLADGVARALAEVDDRPETARLVLEVSAGGGSGLGTSLDELVAVAEAIAVRGVPDRRVGFCLDTAHAWGAGIDLSTADAVDRFVAAFDERIGLDRLPLIHLNDSKAACGSRLDRHEHIGAGRIGHEGLARVLTSPALAGAVYLLETPGMDEGYDAVNIARAYDLAAGRALTPLPSDAMAVRGSRSRARHATRAPAKAGA